MNGSLNPHWIGDVCCRDYRIGGIILKSVPDRFVMQETGYNAPYLTVGDSDDFVKNCSMVIPFSKSWVIQKRD
jgi:hypothetical protein